MQGKDRNEIGLAEGRPIVRIDPKYFRPTEVEKLLGDPTKAKEKLGWNPEYNFDQLVSEMVNEDYKLAKRDIAIIKYQQES